VTASSNSTLLSTYAVHRLDDSLTLLVINKSPTATFNANFAIKGYTPQANATALLLRHPPGRVFGGERPVREYLKREFLVGEPDGWMGQPVGFRRCRLKLWVGCALRLHGRLQHHHGGDKWKLQPGLYHDADGPRRSCGHPEFDGRDGHGAQHGLVRLVRRVPCGLGRHRRGKHLHQRDQHPVRGAHPGEPEPEPGEHGDVHTHRRAARGNPGLTRLGQLVPGRNRHQTPRTR
jgi:hypothetical protein